MEKQAIRVERVELSDDGGQLQIGLSIANDTARTQHAVVSVRGYDWDADRKKLSLRLYDSELPQNSSVKMLQFVRPQYKQLESGAVTQVSVVLPRTLRQLDPHTGKVVLWQIHEAEEITLRLAYADVPFYPDTRESKEGVSEPKELLAASAQWCQKRLKAVWNRPSGGKKPPRK